MTTISLARNVRRLWLFIRLYFFCYLLSEDGTWFRMFLVTFAVLTAALSETDVPRRFHRAVFDPIQRHLESLVPLERPRLRHTRSRQRDRLAQAAGIRPWGNRDGRTGDSETPDPSVPAQPNIPERGDTEERPQGFRRVERAVALFLASLVPGIGERHIAARNAAENRDPDRLAREESEEDQQQEYEVDSSLGTDDTTETQPQDDPQQGGGAIET